ncbi:MAG: hypothetical protein ACWA6U_07085 [Breznakibacter sp.]
MTLTLTDGDTNSHRGWKDIPTDDGEQLQPIYSTNTNRVMTSKPTEC